MKRAQFDVEDVIALLLLTIIILLLLILLSLSGCNKRYSRATMESEKENIRAATRTLLSYLNSEAEYDNRGIRISDLISELYTTQDTSEKDKIQKIVIEKTKEILGKKKCWTIIVIANPSIRIESDKCKEIEPLHVMKSQVRVTTKIPNGMENLEVEYQEYLFRLKEIGGR